MLLRNLTIFLFFFLIGCNPNLDHADLSPDLVQVVVDYQSWIQQNESRLQDRLDEDDTWRHDIVGLAQQSWKSEYFEEHGWTGKSSTVAYALPEDGNIGLIVTHPIWDEIRTDYGINRDIWVNGDHGEFVYQFGDAIDILCHENAHNIFVPPHADVYTLGYTCLDLWIEENLFIDPTLNLSNSH